MVIFHETIQMLEGQDRRAVESAAIPKAFEVKLEARSNGNFVPSLVLGLLRELEENGTLTRDTFSQTSTSFFDTAVMYVAAWGKRG